MLSISFIAQAHILKTDDITRLIFNQNNKTFEIFFELHTFSAREFNAVLFLANCLFLPKLMALITLSFEISVGTSLH